MGGGGQKEVHCAGAGAFPRQNRFASTGDPFVGRVSRHHWEAKGNHPGGNLNLSNLSALEKGKRQPTDNLNLARAEFDTLTPPLRAVIPSCTNCAQQQQQKPPKGRGSMVTGPGIHGRRTHRHSTTGSNLRHCQLIAPLSCHCHSHFSHDTHTRNLQAATAPATTAAPSSTSSNRLDL